MNDHRQEMTIGQLARRAGVHVETIRYYQRKGLMRVPDKPWSGIRRYADDDLTRLRFIRSAQTLGFTLAEIRELLRLEDGTRKLLTECESGRGKQRCPLIESLHEKTLDN